VVLLLATVSRSRRASAATRAHRRAKRSGHSATRRRGWPPGARPSWRAGDAERGLSAHLPDHRTRQPRGQGLYLATVTPRSTPELPPERSETRSRGTPPVMTVSSRASGPFAAQHRRRRPPDSAADSAVPTPRFSRRSRERLIVVAARHPCAGWRRRGGRAHRGWRCTAWSRTRRGLGDRRPVRSSRPDRAKRSAHPALTALGILAGSRWAPAGADAAVRSGLLRA